MAIMNQSPFFKSLLLAGVMSLAACGGGGGGDKKPAPVPDTTPNAFTFTAQTNAELSAVVSSAAVTISGIDAAAPVTITGGEYSIAGGAFTSAAGTVTNGQTLSIRLTAPAANSTSASAQLTVGGVAATFTVTTKVDSIPNAFAFTAQTNAALNTEYTSNTITLAGIDTTVPISITGGTYSINGGAFTAAAGTVAVSNTIAVKGTSAGATESTQNVVLTIGGVSATFAITTLPDTTAPVAEFKFPTPYTMSEGNSVKVRGTATDDHAVAAVKVVVRSYKLEAPSTTLSTTEINATPKAAGDYSSWTAEVPLTALAENEVKVIATDDRNNATLPEAANKVVIRQADVASAFPDAVNEFGLSRYATTFDLARNRILVAITDQVIAVDMATGQRSVFIDYAVECEGSTTALVTDPQTARLYTVCSSGYLLESNLTDGSLVGKYTNISSRTIFGLSLDKSNGRNRLVMVEEARDARVIAFSLDSKKFSIISGASEESLISYSNGIAVDGDNYYVTSGLQDPDVLLHKVIKVNAITGAREVFADNTIASGEPFSALLTDGNTAYLKEIVMDAKHNRLLVMESLSGKLFAIDLSTAERSLFKGLSYIGSSRLGIRSRGISLDEINGILLIGEARRNAQILLDMDTREKVILSKNRNDE